MPYETENAAFEALIAKARDMRLRRPDAVIFFIAVDKSDRPRMSIEMLAQPAADEMSCIGGASHLIDAGLRYSTRNRHKWDRLKATFTKIFLFNSEGGPVQ